MVGQGIQKKLLAIFIFILTVSFLGFTCDNGDDEDIGKPGKVPQPQQPQPEDVATVGSETCLYCHAVETSHWLEGPHGNLATLTYDTNGDCVLGTDQGNPSYAGFTDATCATCHDPLQDGENLKQNVSGNVDRPVIGCESCHGGGAEHFGTGDIPFPLPTMQQCAKCHLSPDSHETDTIFNVWQASAHGQSMNSHIYENGKVRARCARCHTDQGLDEYDELVPGTTGHDDLEEFFLGIPAEDAANFNAVDCTSCHPGVGHDASPDSFYKGPTMVNGVLQSSQYTTCTQCHQLSGLDGDVLSGSTDGCYHDPAANIYGSLDEIISDTHAAVPGDSRLNTGASAQALYFVNKTAANACTVCHDPHSVNLDINRQYAQSGHGDALGEAWTHYDWRHSSRLSCARCHTTTGYKKFADAMAVGGTYTIASADFSQYAGFNSGAIVSTDDQKESLYCWGCHTDNKGALRNPAAYKAEWKDMDGVTLHQYGNLSGSNVCMPCHSGRASGGNLVAIPDVTFGNTSFKNSHYLVAGITLFKNGLYEYPGGTYTNVSYFEHDLIGLGGLGSTVDAAAGTNGPCVACHMTGNPQSHLFAPVEKDGETITAISSSALCATCHNGIHALTTEELNTQKEEFQDSLEALRYFLNLKGFYWGPNSPYLFNSAALTTAQKDWILEADANTGYQNGRHNMGAAFNLNVLKHEEGAFAHNRMYTKRIIYDSIDWIDNAALDRSVAASLAALAGPSAPVWLPGTQAYILSSGGRP